MKLLLTGLIFLIAGGCSVFPKVEPSAEHDFGFPLSGAEKNQLSQAQVNVVTPEWLADTRIRYRLLYASPTQVRFYSLDRWIAPPNELFEQMLTTSNKTWPSAYTVQIQSFEQQFDAPGSAKAVIRFSVVSSSDSRENKILKKDFFLQETCPTADAKGAVTGFSILAKKALDEIASWLDTANR
jgi:cholesterol transport system auxiliary component